MQIHRSHSNNNESWHNPDEFMDYWPRTVLLVADAFALAWAGIWLGLQCKGRIRAILAGLTLVLLVPWVIKLMIITLAPNRGSSIVWANAWTEEDVKTLQTMATLFPALLVDLVVMVWTSSRLPQNFRQLALQRQRENPA